MYTKTLSIIRPYFMTMIISDNYPFGMGIKIVVDDDVIYENDLDLNANAKECASETLQQLERALNRATLQSLSDDEETSIIKFLELVHFELIEEWKQLYSFEH